MADNLVPVAAGVILSALGGQLILFGVLSIGGYFFQKHRRKK
jgi:hypothetical protein